MLNMCDKRLTRVSHTLNARVNVGLRVYACSNKSHACVTPYYKWLSYHIYTTVTSLVILNTFNVVYISIPYVGNFRGGKLANLVNCELFINILLANCF